MISTRLIPLILVLLTACGKNIELPKENQRVVSTTYSNSPILLKLQDAGHCTSSRFQIKNSAYKLYIYLRGRHEVLERDFSFAKNSNLLKDNSTISGTFFGEEVETLFSRGRNQNFINIPREELNLCSTTKNYSPLTIESVAINAAYYINKTKDKFSGLFPHLNVTPITLNILPKIKKSFLSKNMAGETIKISSFMTDNAFYMGRDPSITFLPHSIDMKKVGFNANLWEVPMVISHEYGHHLFQTIFKGTTDNLGLHNCFGNHLEDRQLKNKRLTLGRVEISDVINAYNEGFADLVSFYSLDNEFSLSGVTCLESSRDVNSNSFYNGSFKIFGSRALDSFFSEIKIKSSSCEDSNYQEPHTMGAIFAYSANYYMDFFTKSKDRKYEVIVNWLTEISRNKNELSGLSSEIYLKETFSTFLRIATKELNGTFSNASCRRISEIYPGLEFKECL